MTKRTKLELTRIGKDIEYNLEPRILIERPDLSHDPDGSSDNLLIHGDNLLALKALEQDYAGKVKCIYIDPPYNTGNAFEYYEDGLEHSEWLNLMKPRLEILRSLLRDDWFICCQIDDQEWAYLKVIMDEVFWRANYLTTLYIRVRYADKTLKQDMNFHKEIECIHIYRKNYWAIPNMPMKQIDFEKFCYSIKEKEKWREISLWGKKVVVFEKWEYEIVKWEWHDKWLKEIWASWTILDWNSSWRFFRDYLNWRYDIDWYWVLYKIYWIWDDSFDYRYFTWPNKEWATKGKYFQWVPIKQLESTETHKTSPINNFYDFAWSFGNCRSEWWVDFRGGKKPEKMIEMLLNYFSNKWDIILDSFLWSWSTAAVAHKMHRKWIGIEIWNHAYTHVKVRMDNVINWDKTWISKELNRQWWWSYKFYELWPSLLIQDQYGQRIINKELDGDKLIQALCKIENYHYTYDINGIKHGRSSESSYLHVTTRHINQAIIDDIAKSHLWSNEWLLILARTFDSGIALPSNIRLKKIPKSILTKCEYGKSDYNLPVTESDYDD